MTFTRSETITRKNDEFYFSLQTFGFFIRATPNPPSIGIKACEWVSVCEKKIEFPLVFFNFVEKCELLEEGEREREENGYVEKVPCHSES